MTDQERRELGEALVRVTRERDLAQQNAEAVALYAEERQRERDEARDEVQRQQAIIEDYANVVATLRESSSQTSVVVQRLFDERESARDEVVRLGRNLEGVQKILDLAEIENSGDGVVVGVASLLKQRNDERLHGALLLAEIERVQTVVRELDAVALITQQVGVRVDIEQPRRSEKVGDVMTHLAEPTARRASEVWHGWTPVVRDVINWHGPWRELGAAEAAEPPEEIEALRPGDPGFDEWLLEQPGGSE